MKVHRHLAPTAAPLSVGDLRRSLLGLIRGQHLRTQIEAEIKRYFGVGHVFLFSSGKAALATIIRALAATSSRRKVIISAYTCFSVPSAIVKAGGQVVLCDVDPHTLDFDFNHLQRIVDNETLCIVSAHLLGQAADIPRTKSIAKPYAIPVIEDAAQAMGQKLNEGWAGTIGDVGIFSLGRGKNITAGSGGVIITKSNDLAAMLAKIYADVPEESFFSRAVNAIMVVVMTFLIHPRAYWFPAGLPFLGLGETVFDPAFPVWRLDGIRAGLLRTWKQRLEQSNEDRMRHAQQYLSAFRQGEKRLDPVRVPGLAYLRLPIVMPSVQEKQELCAEGKAQGLGVSALYPAPISKIPELRTMFEGQQYPGAEILAERLVTLPVHHYVDGYDIARICQVLHEIVTRVQHPPLERLSRLTELSAAPSKTRAAHASNGD